MRAEDLRIREIRTTTSQRAIEIELTTRKGKVQSSVPFFHNGIYRLHHLAPEQATKKFLDIKRHFLNNDFSDNEEVDHFLKELDTSVDFRTIGGNLAFGISSAFLKAFAQRESVEVHDYLAKGKAEIPTPLGIITDKERNQTDFHQYMLYPVSQKIFSKGIGKLLPVFADANMMFNREKNLTMGKILKILSSFTTKHALQIGINFSAPHLWNGRRYTYSTLENLTTQEQLLFVQDIAQNHPVGYLEDPFHEDDFILFSTLTHRLPTRLVAGNHLYSNNLNRIKTGMELKASSALVITPAEMGTVTDFVNTVREARRRRLSTVVAQSEHDTEDLIACHLAAGASCDFVKLDFSRHMNKVNEFVRMEEKLK